MSPKCFSFGCAALANLRVSQYVMCCHFSRVRLKPAFESSGNRITGLYCSALRARALERAGSSSSKEDAPDRRFEGSLSILENCIEKNIHVPNMKSGPHDECGCNFDSRRVHVCQVRGSVKIQTSLSKVNKSTQVDTLAPQAMKDVASCDKLGGAANER